MITLWMKLGGNLGELHKIFYMPSRTDLPSHELLGRKSKCSGTRQIQTADLSVHTQTCQPPDNPKLEDKLYPGSSTWGGGDLLPIGGSSTKTAMSRVGHPQGAGLPVKYPKLDDVRLETSKHR